MTHLLWVEGAGDVDGTGRSGGSGLKVRIFTAQNVFWANCSEIDKEHNWEVAQLEAYMWRVEVARLSMQPTVGQLLHAAALASGEDFTESQLQFLEENRYDSQFIYGCLMTPTVQEGPEQARWQIEDIERSASA